MFRYTPPGMEHLLLLRLSLSPCRTCQKLKCMPITLSPGEGSSEVISRTCQGEGASNQWNSVSLHLAAMHTSFCSVIVSMHEV